MTIYDEKAVTVRFLLGGIVTSNISVDQRDELMDFEIFNNIKKGFALHTRSLLFTREGETRR